MAELEKIIKTQEDKDFREEIKKTTEEVGEKIEAQTEELKTEIQNLSQKIGEIKIPEPQVIPPFPEIPKPFEDVRIKNWPKFPGLDKVESKLDSISNLLSGVLTKAPEAKIGPQEVVITGLDGKAVDLSVLTTKSTPLFKGGGGGTSIRDDTAFTFGTTDISPTGGTYKSTRDQVDDGDAGAFAMSQFRAQFVSLETPLGDSAMDDTNNLVKTGIYNSSGVQVDTFGGTQYTEGDVDASITGVAAMMEVAGNTLQPIQGTVADGLLVNLGTNNDVTVTGTVAVTQSGTWTVQPGNTPNTSPWLASIHDGTTKATVRDLAANDALNVALVDGSGNQITAFAGTEFADGAVRGTATGTLIMGDDGTNIQSIKVDSAGELQVDVLTMPSVTVTATNLDIRDLVFATDKVDVSGSTGVGVTGTFFQATQPVSIAGTVTVDTELPAAAALANDTASPTAPAVGAFGMVRDVGDGNWDMMTAIQAAPNLAAADSGVQAVGLMAQLDDTSPTSITENQFGNVRMSSRRALLVEGVASGTAIQVGDNSGTLTVDAPVGTPVAIRPSDGAAFLDPVTTSNPLAVAGTAAHDAADTGNPQKVGFKARTTNPTAVADADRVDSFGDDLGRLVVVKDQVRDLVAHNNITIASSSAETTLLAAGAAGVFHDLKKLVLTNSSATAVTCTIKDATAGTTRMIIDLGAVGSNSAVTLDWDTPHPQAATAQNWTLTLSSAVVTVHAYILAVKNV